MKQDDEVISVLISLLNDTSDLDMRIAAAEGLGYTGFSGARMALMQIVDDKRESPALRQAAVRALGRTVSLSQ